MLLSQCVHALPERIVQIGHQLLFRGKPFHRFPFPNRMVRVDVVEDFRLQYKERSVDPSFAELRLLGKMSHPVPFEVQASVAGWRTNCRDCGQTSMRTVKRKEFI